MLTNPPVIVTFVPVCQFYVYLPFAQCPFRSVINMKALVGVFNQEKALVGAFSYFA